MKSSGKNKSATKSSATIGDFFPLKKSTTKNKRNKDEQERPGKKKLKKNEENIFSNKPEICEFEFQVTHNVDMSIWPEGENAALNRLKEFLNLKAKKIGRAHV